MGIGLNWIGKKLRYSSRTHGRMLIWYGVFVDILLFEKECTASTEQLHQMCNQVTFKKQYQWYCLSTVYFVECNSEDTCMYY